MNDFIEREDAIKAVKHAWAKGIEPTQYIEIIPSADVETVVRCGGCINYKLKGGQKWCVFHMIRMRSDDFCSYGKRRETE